MHTVALRTIAASLAAVAVAGCGVDTKNNSSVKISSISPDTGSITGGTEVQIGGKGFDGGAPPTVVFGANEAEVTNYSENQISAVLPAGLGCGNVDLQINNSNGFALDENAFTYTGGSSPLTITSVEPALGDVAGGTTITITGSGFTGGAGVLLSGIPLLDIVVGNDTTMTARTPPVSVGGIKDLQVRNCSDEQILEGAFMFTSPLNGGYVELPLYDYVNPQQFSNNPLDYIDPFVAFVEPSAESLLNPIQTLDTCVLNPPDPGAGNFTIVDVGPDVSLTSGSQTITLELQDDTLYYYDATDTQANQTTKFVFNAAYSLSGSGNATTPSFTTPAAFMTPADITITTPANIAGTTPATIQRTNQQFVWNATSPGDLFELILVGYDNAGAPTDKVLDCVLTDDGNYTIATADLNKLTTATTQMIFYAIRRKDTPFILPSNGSQAVAVGQVYKVGVLYFP